MVMYLPLPFPNPGVELLYSSGYPRPYIGLHRNSIFPTHPLALKAYIVSYVDHEVHIEIARSALLANYQSGERV